MTDDHHLIEQLRHTMRAHTAEADVPERFAEHARRTARRRTARRAAVASAPVLAAAGVAIALVAGAGSGRGSPRAASFPQVTVGAGQAQDTAFIVGKVKADVVADSHDNGIVTYGTDYGSGHVTSHGALTGLTRRSATMYTYTAPDGAVYWRSELFDKGGETSAIESDIWIPSANGRYTSTTLLINAAARTYSRSQQVVDAPFQNGPAPNIDSRPSAVRRALQQGQVTLQGTTTIDRTRAIVLSVTRPAQGAAPAERLVLYVNARTYQPLRTVDAYASRFGVDVQDWLPATARNIAMAEDHAIPDGYVRVARAY